jgi:hypothetical protein
MGLFYKHTQKELLKIRYDLVMQKLIPALQSTGYERAPFADAWYGRDEHGGYCYTLCRLTNSGLLEMVTISIHRGDRWIQVYLNIFALSPAPVSLDQLKGVDSLPFLLPPHSIQNMRLGSDDIKGVPLFNYRFLFQQYRLRRHLTKGGMARNIKRLGTLLERDMTNIDRFVQNWHELHKPKPTSWEGQLLVNT